GWLAMRLAVSWHSPRAADIVDMWRMFAGFTQMVERGGNFLTESVGRQLPGVNAVPFFMVGLPILQAAGTPPTLSWVQAGNAFWMALAAFAVATIARALVGTAVAPVAAAVLLFSPYALLAPMGPTTIFLGPFFTAVPALL